MGHTSRRQASPKATCSITSERNQETLLAYRLQATRGDPSPATTTGRRFGMTPPAVRQVVKRTRDRLRNSSRASPRYASLAGLPLADELSRNEGQEREAKSRHPSVNWYPDLEERMAGRLRTARRRSTRAT